MPLKSGTTAAIHGSNVDEMMKSKTFGKGQSASTKKRMAFAAAYRKARESGARSRGGKTMLKAARGEKARRRAGALRKRTKKG